MAGTYWHNWSVKKSVPQTAIRGGTDVDGSPIYVGRVQYNCDLLPAKVIPTKNVAYVSHGGNEVALTNCQILCESRTKWVANGHGRVPTGAIKVGNTSNGESLYAGRVFHQGSHCVGKVHPSHGCCYIPFGGKEIKYQQYEVLVMPHH